MCSVFFVKSCALTGNGANVTNSSVNERTTTLPKEGPSIPFLGPYNPDLMSTVKLTDPTTPATPFKEKSTLSGPLLSTRPTEHTPTKESAPEMPLVTAPVEPVTIKPMKTESPKDKLSKYDSPKKKSTSSPLPAGPENSTSSIDARPPSPFFNTAITPSPHIPVGVINPDKLPAQETNDQNLLNGPPKGPTVNPAFLEHLLEYHKFKDDVKGNVKPQHVPPQQVLLPYNVNNGVHPQNGYNGPLSPVVRPGDQQQNQIFPPYNRPVVPQPKPDASEDYEDNPYAQSPAHEQQPIPPELYHLIHQGHHHDPYAQHNRVTSPPPQFSNQDELYHVIDNRNRLPPKAPSHPYYNNIPSKQVPHIFQRPGSPIGLADIIDHIRQHEETDSRTKDTHVYVLASQPPNVGQGLSNKLLYSNLSSYYPS